MKTLPESESVCQPVHDLYDAGDDADYERALPCSSCMDRCQEASIAGTMQVGDMMAYIQYTMMIIMSFLMITMMSIMLPRASWYLLGVFNEILEYRSGPSGSGESGRESRCGEKRMWWNSDHVSFTYPERGRSGACRIFRFYRTAPVRRPPLSEVQAVENPPC